MAQRLSKLLFLLAALFVAGLWVSTTLPLSAQNAGTATHAQPTVIWEIKHDLSPPLSEMQRTAHSLRRLRHEAEPVRRIPVPPAGPQAGDTAMQRSVITRLAATTNLNFDGLGNGANGFTVNSAPPDTDGAVGTTQYVQLVNSSYAIFSKSTGARTAGPFTTNTVFSGFGGGCQTNDDGDGIVMFDKIASRWVITQFSVTTTPYLECVAVSTTADATGTYNRYSFQYANFPDYPKLGTWPDAYYVTYNVFNGNTFLGADICALNRSAILSGTTANQVCFQQSSSVGGVLPSDFDGTTQPPVGSPAYFITYNTNSLDLYKFHVDFSNTANSTFTGPTNIPVASFSALCGGGTCVPQPGTTNQLDSLADRMMYRLAYRNFGSHESLVTSHSVTGGVRWYEIQNPNGTPQVAQQGTFGPDSATRWMSSVAMDQAGDIGVGYSKSSSSVDPSVLITGRVPSDPAGTLESETSVVAGTGVQNGTLTRWGDYSSMQVDPVDDCTFWYTGEYMKTTGTFNWNTRIVSFKFPGCGGGGTNTTATLSPSSLTFASTTVGSSSAPQAVTLTNNNSSAAISITSVAASGDYSQTNNCGTSLAASASCTINVTFTPTAVGTRTGTLTVTDGATNSPQTASLTGTGASSGGGCTSGVLSNQGFENGNLSCWTTGGVFAPTAVTVQKHGGSFSAQLGASAAPEPNGDSSIFQAVSIPSNATAATLTFWYWPSTTDTITYDWQEAQVRNSSGTTLASIMKVASNTQTWTQVTYDLTSYKGQTIQLYFNVHGDGYGDLTYMYLDDVSLAITTGTPDTTAPSTSITAPANGATVSGTVSVTATASDVDNPTISKMEIYVDGALKSSNTNANSITYAWATTGVANGSHTLVSKAYDAAGNVGTSATVTVTVNNTSSQLIQNGGFETGTLANWTSGGVLAPVTSTTQKHAGSYSAKLGGSTTPEPNGDSSIYQTITIPGTATSATLSFYYRPSTTDTITYDWQEAQVRNTSGTTLASIMKVASNTQAWTNVTYDLTSYKGQTIRLYFNVHGDGYGDLTYMYLDDVTVTVK